MVSLTDFLFTAFWIVGCIILLTLGILNSQGITKFGHSENTLESNISGFTTGLLWAGGVFGVASIIFGAMLWSQIQQEKEDLAKTSKLPL